MRKKREERSEEWEQAMNDFITVLQFLAALLIVGIIIEGLLQWPGVA